MLRESFTIRTAVGPFQRQPMKRAIFSVPQPFVGRVALVRRRRSRRLAARNSLFFTKSAGFQHSAIKRANDDLSHAERVLTDLGKQNNFDVTATKTNRLDGDLNAFDAFLSIRPET